MTSNNLLGNGTKSLTPSLCRMDSRGVSIIVVCT